MTKPLPHRRQLAAHPDQERAQRAAFGDQGWMKQASGVEVVHRPRWAGDERPWAVTAAKAAA